MVDIKITVDDISLSTVVADVISYDDDGDAVPEGVETVGDKVAQIIAKEAMRRPEYATLRDRVTEMRKEIIREELRPIITAALHAPLRKTNTYGEPTGATTTLNEMIMEEAAKAWATSKDSYGRDKTTVQDVIRTEVRAHINEAVAKAVKEAQEAALKAIGDVAASPVIEAVKKALGK